MRILILLLMASLAYRPAHAAPAEPVSPSAPVDNAVQPCDHSAATGKPPCDADSGSIVVPPAPKTAPGDVITPPAPDSPGLQEPPDPLPPPLPPEEPPEAPARRPGA
ncbi:MAG TPA: hypothetical protein VFS17_03340 [Methylophilaceae bacterium]|nr:hypothetical protein [Methylophilaceae bacterium]